MILENSNSAKGLAKDPGQKGTSVNSKESFVASASDNKVLLEEYLSLQNEIIDYTVELETKQGIVNELEKWKGMLIGLSENAPKASIAINQSIDDFAKTESEILEIKKEFVTLRRRYLDLHRNYELKREQKAIEERNLANLDVKNFDIERENLESTLKMLNEEGLFLMTKNDTLLQELRSKKFYSSYEETRREVERTQQELANYLNFYGQLPSTRLSYQSGNSNYKFDCS